MTLIKGQITLIMDWVHIWASFDSTIFSIPNHKHRFIADGWIGKVYIFMTFDLENAPTDPKINIAHL